MTFSDKRFRVLAWLSVSEVPHVATTPRTPFCQRPIRSMYPSTTSTRPSLRMEGSAWHRPYRREPFRYSSDSGEFRYFGTASSTARPPKPQMRPRASAIGKSTRPRNRSLYPVPEGSRRPAASPRAGSIPSRFSAETSSPPVPHQPRANSRSASGVTPRRRRNSLPAFPAGEPSSSRYVSAARRRRAKRSSCGRERTAPPSYRTATPYRSASSSTESAKERMRAFIRKWKTDPPSPQPKHLNACRAGWTKNDGGFSRWKGHKPRKLAPARDRGTVSETTSTMSDRSRTSRIVLSEIRPPKNSPEAAPGPLSLWCQEAPNRFADRLAVGPARHLRHERLHDAPHVGREPGPGFRDRLAHGRLDLRRGEPLREVPVEDGDLALLLRGELRAIPLEEQPDRFATLLDHRGDHLEDRLLGERSPLRHLLPGDRLDLPVLHRGHGHPQSRKGQGVALLGRRLHILMQLFLESQSALPGHLLQFLQRALSCRQRLLFLLDAGLFIMFPLADFRKDPGLLALLLETLQYALEGLLFLHADARHGWITPSVAK